jgi:hypothetical protein
LHYPNDAASFDAARDLPSTVNLNLLVAHLAGNLAGGTHRKSFGDLQVALKAPNDLGIDDGGCPRKQAPGSDPQFLARYFGADLSFYHEAVAILDLPSNNERPSLLRRS